MKPDAKKSILIGVNNSCPGCRESLSRTSNTDMLSHGSISEAGSYQGRSTSAISPFQNGEIAEDERRPNERTTKGGRMKDYDRWKTICHIVK